MERIPNGSLDRLVSFIAVDVTDLYTRETGLTSFTVYYVLNNGKSTAMTTPITTEKDDTNMPGLYSLLIDESGMTNMSGDTDSEILTLHITHASIAPVTMKAEVYKPIADNITDTASMQYVLDTLLRTILSGTLLNTTTIATLTSQTSFTLSDGSSDDDAYNDCMIIFKDSENSYQRAIGLVLDYAGNTKTITLAADPDIFILSVTDEVFIMAVPKNIADIKKLIRADKSIDITETPWVVDYKEEGTENVLMSKTMKNTSGDNIVTVNNVLGQLEKEV